MWDQIGTSIGIFIPIMAAAVTYVFDQRAKRRSASEQFQLDKIEEILTVIVTNAHINRLYPPGSPEKLDIDAQTQKAMTLIRIYGNSEVCAILERAGGEKYTPAQIEELLTALQNQGRALIGPRR